MNVLLTSAGRRHYLVEYFREALGDQGKVFAADLDPNASALQAADKHFIVPPFTDESYFDHIHRLCCENEVGMLVSLNDLELPLLSRQKERFAASGVTVLVSAPHVIDMCLDKWQTYLRLRDAGIDTPVTFTGLLDAEEALDSGTLSFPVVLKPRWGTGSIGYEIAHSREELRLAFQLLHHKILRSLLADISRQDLERCILIQEMITGSEYGLDIINDLSGNHVTTLVKQKIGMRAGETDKALTVNNEALDAFGESLGKLFQHIGIMDCDVLSDNDGRLAVLELNPRFGGGYPFSHVAGANIPAALLAWARGEDPNPEWLSIRPNVLSAKYDNLIVVVGN